MKRTNPWIWIILIFTVVIIGAYQMGTSFVYVASHGDKQTVSKNSYLVLDLKGNIPEYSEIRQGFFGKEQLSAYDIIQKIKAAKEDSRIVGIILRPQMVQSGYATLHEIQLALQDFKKANKKVYAYLEIAGNKDYYLSMVADEIGMPPTASSGLMLTGIGTNLTFYKDLLDKLGVSVSVLHAGKFKSYGNEYTRNDATPEMRENLQSLLGEIYKQWSADIAADRKLSKDQVEYILAKRPQLMIDGNTAKNMKLADKLTYEEDYYRKLNAPKEKRISIQDYSKGTDVALSGNIAVVYAEGTITNADAGMGNQVITSRKMAKIFDAILENPSIKATVIRVNSPGGSALESELIHHKLEQLKKAMPVVISMGDVAASGGYYLSSGANYIVADPYTITGSIGVVTMLPNFSGTGKKLGIRGENISYGKFTSMYGLWNAADPQVIESMQVGVDATYAEFKQRVSDGRKLSLAQVENVAQGRVWSANQAKGNGLVDAVGSIQVAIDKAATLAHVGTPSIVAYPKVRFLWQYVMEEGFNLRGVQSRFSANTLEEMGLREAIQCKRNFEADARQMLMPFKFEM